MKEKTIFSRRMFRGRLIQVDLLKVKLENGRQARREVVRHPGAVAVLCRLPDGKFVFVRQFRKPVEGELLEVVAGTREAGEGAAACVRREIQEETGFKAVKLHRMGTIYTAPGFCSEKIIVYFADLGRAGGLPACDPDECIELVCLSQRRVESMLASGKIHDAKTLAAWLMFKMRQGTK